MKNTMNKLIFDIKNNGKKITNIVAENFKDAIKEFAETYDMPNAEFDRINKNNIFSATHSDTTIEFQYIHKERAYIGYKFGGSKVLLKIDKKI